MYCQRLTLPTSEPVSLADAKNFLRLYSSDQDATITTLLVAAREFAENETGRALAQGSFVQVMDAFPYYTDTIVSQQAYPPSYYSLPRYSTTLWNYSQMIKLVRSPVIAVTKLTYVQNDGTLATLTQDSDFILDRTSEPARIFPTPGNFWPPCLYVPNALKIEFTAGYDPDPTKTDAHTVTANPPSQQSESKMVTGVPQVIRLAILQIVAHWFRMRESVSELNLKEVPQHCLRALQNNAVIDYCPTRG